MAVYGYSEEYIEESIAKHRRLRNWFVVIVSLIFAIICLVYFYSPRSPILRIPIWAPLFGIAVTIFLPWNWKGWPDKVRRSLRQTSVEISSYSVVMSGPSKFKREMCIGDILRAEEASFGSGYYLRTSNRYRWIAIPRRLSDYDAIGRELRAAGIRVVRTIIPPNWEEFLGMLLVAATLIVSVAVHDIRVLTANLLFAVLLSCGGFFVINAASDIKALPLMRRARFGAFLPTMFAAAGLWFAMHR